MSTAQNANGGLESKVDFDGLVSHINQRPTAPAYTSLQAELNEKAHLYFKDHKDAKNGKLSIDENRAKELSDLLWNSAAEHVVRNHIFAHIKDPKAREAKIAELKSTPDPDSGKTQYEQMAANSLGIEKQTFYLNLLTRGTVDATQIDTLARPLYETHLNASTSKRVADKINDNKVAVAALQYAASLKALYPHALESVSIPQTFRSVEDVQRTLIQIAGALPRDYPIQKARSYATQAHN